MSAHPLAIAAASVNVWPAPHGAHRAGRRKSSMMRLGIAAGLALAGCRGSPSAPQAALNVGMAPLWHFEWAAVSGLDAAHAMVLSIDDGTPPIVVTAHHVGSGGASWDNIGAIVKNPQLRNPFSDQILAIGANLPVPGAHTISSSGSQDDLAAFRIANPPAAGVLRLATTLPVNGDTVWVLATQVDGRPTYRHRALTVISEDDAFIYVYLDPVNNGNMSGAAVLDRAGRVVGVNVGSLLTSAQTWNSYAGRYPQCCAGRVAGEAVGLGVGVKSIREHLAPIAK